MALASVSGYDQLRAKDEDWEDAAEVESAVWPQDLAKLRFELAPHQNSKDFVDAHFGNGSCKLHFLKGTTTLAFVYKPKTPQDKGGIVVAVDSRASSGAYIATQNVMKVLEISDHMVATMAGGAADCQFWIRQLAKQCRLYELQNKEKMSVAAASKFLANMIYGYKGMGLSMGTMVAGWDKRGPGLFYVDSEGTRLKGNLFSCGSGSLNAYGYLDSTYQPVMTDQEAQELGRRAIMHATYRDTGSGGWCNLYHVSADGQRYLGKTDVSDKFYSFMAEVKRDTWEPTV